MAGESTDVPPIPITVRQLEAIIRIAESLARMSLQTIATGTCCASGWRQSWMVLLPANQSSLFCHPHRGTRTHGYGVVPNQHDGRSQKRPD